jgi:enediyne polyketide synthase
MVTNHSDIHVIGEVGCMDLIEGRLRLGEVYGKFDSSLDMHFEWFKIHENGSEQKVASSSLATTWVEIMSHGVVEVRPFPDYMRDFIGLYLPGKEAGAPANTQRARMSEDTGHPSSARSHLGSRLYRAPKGPRTEPELLTQVFHTTSAESNLVGNIYYSNYYHWKSRLIDGFVHDISKTLFSADGRRGEFRCVRSAVKHLREAMPFDRIEVVMALQALYTKGIGLHFDFYKLADNGHRLKIALGDFEARWVDADAVESSEIPDLLMSVLLGLCRISERGSSEDHEDEYPSSVHVSG